MRAVAGFVLFGGMILATAGTGHAQSVGNYAPVTRTTGITYTSIATTGASLSGWRGSGTDDNRSQAQPIGFTFYYDGQAFTTFSLSTNGYLDLSAATATGSGTGAYGYANSMFSAVNGTLLALAPLYDDLDVESGGTLANHFKVQLDGTPGSQVLTAEWCDVRYRGASGSDINMQVKLYEGTGVIEFRYGTMAAGTATYSYTCGINGTTMSSPPLPSELLTQQTANTATFGATPQNALATIPAGFTQLTFTPLQHVTPAAPLDLTFSSVLPTSITLGWTDNSTTETYFAVLRSLDGVTFVPAGAAVSTTTEGTGTPYALTVTGLIPGTIYHFRVTANNEASPPSPYLEGSQATSPPGEIVSIASGLWSAPTTWSTGAVPTATDNVTIADGHTVTIDAPAGCWDLTVGQGSSGVLDFETTTARTLTAAGNVTVAPGGTFQTAATGTVTTHALSVAGSLTNQGTLDFSTNANTAGGAILFTGGANASFGGAGAVTDLRTLTVNKGTSPAAVLELTPSAFTVQGSSTDGTSSAFLTLTNGTLKVSGTFTGTHRTFTTAAYSIGATAGFWLDNPNYTVAGQNGSPTVSGQLRLTQGTYNVGTSTGNSMSLATGATMIVEGGAYNVTGRLQASSTSSVITYRQTGGTVTVNAYTSGHSSSTYASFDMGSAASSSVTIAGGSIVLQNAGTASSGPRDFRNNVGIYDISPAATLQLGNASTPAAKTYYLQGFAPSLVITNLFNHAGTLVGVTYVGDATLNPGTTFTLNGYRCIVYGASFTNHGTLNGTTASSGLYFLGAGSFFRGENGQELCRVRDGSLEHEARAVTAWFDEEGPARVAQTYAGSGTVTAPLTALEIDNPAGVTISAGIPANVVAARVNLFRGTLVNSSLITLGNGGATAAVTQTGAAGMTTPGGMYDVAPVFNYGTGGYTVIYAQEGVGRLTGYEIPAGRSFNAMTVNTTNGVTVTGGGMTLTTGLTLIAGLVHTGAGNLLTLANSVATPPSGSSTSFVEGPLGIEFNVTSATNRTYAIGKGADFRPMIVKNVNTGGVSQTFTAEVFNTAPGGTPLPPLCCLDPARYWTVSNSVNLNADARINLTYGADDDVPSPGCARIAQSDLAAGNYTSLGGAGTSSTVESTLDLTPGNDYFTIGLENPPLAWDGGAGTTFWGDAANWDPDGVPTAASDVALAAAGATTIDVNGDYAANNLDVGSSITLNLGANHLTLNGDYRQFAGTIDLGSGTLEVLGAFTVSAGTYTANTGTTLFSGTAAQLIGGGVTHYDLVLRHGGAGVAKTLTAGNAFTVSHALTVESTAQLALSAATATTLTDAGDLNYAGLPGGANVGSLTLSLTGSGKTINGASFASGGPAFDVTRAGLDRVRDEVVSLATHPSRLEVTVGPEGEKRVRGYENTRVQRAGEIESILAAADPNARVTIVLDDATLVRNPLGFGDERTDPTFDLPVAIAATASYTLGSGITIETGRLLTIAGRLNCSTYSIGGGGGISVNGSTGVLGTATTDPNGLGATILTTGTNTYSDGAIVEYNALGDQTVHAASHPASAMLFTAGSGTKTLDANLTITGSSGSALTKGALWVNAGSAFGDGGYRLSFTTGGYANVIVYGGFASSDGGSISYESGPYLSNLLTVDGTHLGDLLINFSSSTSSLYMNAGGTATTYFRNLTFGGTAGSGLAGGTLSLGKTGTTHVVAAGDVNLVPATVSNTGGGFNGYGSGTTNVVTVLGNVTSTSTAATQPIMGSTGTNTLILGGSAPQAFTVATSATVCTGATLKIDSVGGVTLGSAGPLTYTVGGTLNLASGTIATQTNVLAIPATGSVVRAAGHVIGNLQKHVAMGGAVARTFEIGTGGDYAPVALTFGNVTTAGNVIATTAAGDHPNLGESILDPAQSVNRSWTLTNAGVVFDATPGCDATFGFGPGDLDAGADPDRFYVGNYVAPNWSLPAIGARTATSTQATGLTGFGDFAVAQKLTFTITAAAGPGGAIDPSGVVVVEYGDDQGFAITPEVGHHVVDVRVDDVSQGPITSYLFEDVTANHTITASFAIDVFTITATAGPGGAIDPSGAIPVEYGNDQGFAITPDVGYHVVDVLVDDVSRGPITSYLFEDVAADHTIAASFAIDVFTITATAGPGGTIDPSGGVPVEYGNDQAFAIVADLGHHVVDVLVDDLSQGPITSYRFEDVTANHTIAASFAVDLFTITATAGPGGTIDPVGVIEAAYGDDVLFAIAAEFGYHILDVVVDDESQGPVASYLFEDVTADHTIAATFTNQIWEDRPLALFDDFTRRAAADYQGWILQRAERRYEPSGPVETLDYAPFAPEQWTDGTQYPNLPGTDPAGNGHGALQVGLRLEGEADAVTGHWWLDAAVVQSEDAYTHTQSGWPVGYEQHPDYTGPWYFGHYGTIGAVASPEDELTLRLYSPGFHHANDPITGTFFTRSGAGETLVEMPAVNLAHGWNVLRFPVSALADANDVRELGVVLGSRHHVWGDLYVDQVTLGETPYENRLIYLTPDIAWCSQQPGYQTAPVSVYYDDGGGALPGIRGLSLRVLYPAGVGQVVSVTPGDLLSGTGSPTHFEYHDDGSGTLIIDWAILGQTTGAGGHGKLATITFAGADPLIDACGPVSFDAGGCRFRDPNNVPITNLNFIGGTVAHDILGSAAPVLASPTHVPGAPTFLDDVTITWPATEDADPGTGHCPVGMRGYYLLCDQNPSGAPDPSGGYSWFTPWSPDSLDYTVTFGDMAEGTWYVHVIGYDWLWNASEVAHFGPVPIDKTLPGPVADLDAWPIEEADRSSGVSWTPPPDPDLAGVAIYRMGTGGLTGTTYPEYDDDPDFVIPGIPASRAEALAAGWTFVGNYTGTNTLDAPAERDCFTYVAYAYDTAGNYGLAGDGSHDATLDYWLGDFNGTKNPNYQVDVYDVLIISLAYYTAEGDPAYNPVCDIGPTADYGRMSLPMTDNLIEFEDIMILAMNYEYAQRGRGEAPRPEPCPGSMCAQIERFVGEEEVIVRVLLAGNPGCLKGASVQLAGGTGLEFIGASAGELWSGAGRHFIHAQREGIVALDGAALNGVVPEDGCHAVARFRITDPLGDLSVRVVDFRARNDRNEEIGGGASGTTEAEEIRPLRHVLIAALPNPTPALTAVRYGLARGERVTLRVYDASGRLIRTLVDGAQRAGFYQVAWDGRGDDGSTAGPGIYFLRMQAGHYTASRKLNLIR